MLTPRDETLLTDLFLNRAMSRTQVEEMHFGSVARANARLRQLFDHGYVLRRYRDDCPYGSQAVYSIAAKAVPLARIIHEERERGTLRDSEWKCNQPL